MTAIATLILAGTVSAAPPAPSAPPAPPSAVAPPVPPVPPVRPIPPGVVVIRSGPEGKIIRVPSRKRAFLGVQLLELTDELRSHFGVAGRVGVLVSKVEDGSPASKAGVQVGDVLVKVDGVPAERTRDVVRAVRKRERGDKIELQVIRKAEKRTLRAELTVRPTPQLDVSGLIQFFPNEGSWQFEVEGEKVVVPFPRVDELRERLLELHQKKELVHERELEKKLEERLQELEKKLEEMEEKLRGDAHKTSGSRDA